MQNAKKNLFNDKGHLNDEGIAGYAEKLIAKEHYSLPESVLSHVEECKLCKSRVMNTIDVLISIKNGSAIAKSHDKLKRESGTRKDNYKELLKYAAIIAILLGLSFLLIKNIRFSHVLQSELVHKDSTRMNQFQGSQNKTERIDSIQEDQKINLRVEESVDFLADNYKESDLFENLLSVEYRDIQEINIKSPSLNQIFSKKDSVIFIWDTERDESWQIKIFNNTDSRPFLVKEVLTTEFCLDTMLGSGLYYWKLETENSLVHVGKFIVQ